MNNITPEVPTPIPTRQDTTATGKPVVAVSPEKLPAHAYTVQRVAGVKGFLWWVIGLRYPVERLDAKTKVLHLSGKPRKWRVAGPFADKAIAEKCINPRSRAP